MASRETQLLYDGFKDFSGGVDSGNAPDAIQPNQISFAVNSTFLGGIPATRPTYNRLDIDWSIVSGKFQGAGFYVGDDGVNAHIVMVGGRMFRVETDPTHAVSEITPRFNIVTTQSVTFLTGAVGLDIYVNSDTLFTVGMVVHIDGHEFTITDVFADHIKVNHTLTPGGPYTIVAGTWVLDASDDGLVEFSLNPSQDEFCFMFQAENYLIVLAGQQAPIIYDGAISRRSDVAHNEVPPGYIGAYVNGRIWIVLTNRRSYAAGDLVGDPSGTLTNGFRDAVLKFTSNTYLLGGGSFSTPANAGLICAIGATATIDTSLGQGPVTIGCENCVFTCNAPVDRTTWASLTYPIQTVAATDYGPVAARAFVNVNADAWFRSLDGIRSFIIARRDFNAGWGNTPMSFEVSRVLDRDTEFLLTYGSGQVFSNRLLMTCSPHRTPQGVIHRGLVVMGFDEIISLRNRDNPAWEGLWTGLQIYQVVKGKVNNEESLFLWARGADINHTIELWEVDNQSAGDTFSITNQNGTQQHITRIACSMEGRTMDFGAPEQPKELQWAELFQRDIGGTFNATLSFRPDWYPCWTQLYSWQECATLDVCNLVCPPLANLQPGYNPRLKTPNPPETCLVNSTVARKGYQFQWKLNWTGRGSIWKGRFAAKPLLSDTIGDCLVGACQSFPCCEDYLFGYESVPASFYSGYLTDEFGNYILDENGNKIIVQI